MQLYRWPTSPYVRKVKVLLLKAGIHDRIDKIFISPFESENTPYDRNLLSETPALVLDAGAVLFDFSMICEYADRTHDGLHLFPKGNAVQWQALCPQADADGVLDALLLRRCEGHLSKTWVVHQMSAVHPALASFEARVDELRDRITIGHINIAVALSYMDFPFSAKDWRHLTPVLPT